MPLIVEALGGIGSRPRRPVPALPSFRFLACPPCLIHSCRKRGRDGTTYSRFHPSNYLSHHLAGIVTAAVFFLGRGAHIVEEIALLNQSRLAPQRRDEDRGGG